MPDDLVWHYTDSEGLIGIAANHTIRASSCSMMNDSSEFSYGAEQIKAAWAERGHIIALSEMVSHSMDGGIVPESLSADKIINSLERMIDNIDYRKLSSPIYITCASRLENNLSQWRAYANHRGFAIGLDISQGYKMKNSRSLTKLYWEDVIYGKDTDKIFATMHTLVGAILRNSEDVNLDSSINSIFVGTAAMLKSQGFSDEAEVRIVVDPIDNITDIVQFRTGAYGLTRFVEVEASDDELLPIRKICIGPTGNAELTELELRAFLDRHGYNEVEIDHSGISVR